jgi:uncharacterized protein (TIRG00374 family)
MKQDNESESAFLSHFGGWKVILAILLGVAASAWMLNRSLQEVKFSRCQEGSGTHRWIDANHNGKIDSHLSSEFAPQKGGNYRKEDALQAIGSINWTFQVWAWILLAIVFAIGRDYFYIVRIRTLSGNELSFRSGFHVIMLWEFASALSPGVIGGTGVAMFIMAREKIPLGRATAFVLVTALMDNLFFVLLIPIVFIFIDHTELFPKTDSVAWLFWTGYGFFLSLTIIPSLAIFVFPTFAKRFLTRISSFRWLKRWEKTMVKTGSDIEQTAIALQKEKASFWIKVFATTCGSWICRYLVINALLHAFFHVSLLQDLLVFGKQAVLWLLMRVSPTPGGSGVAEYAFGTLLNDLGFATFLLAALAILWRLISYFPYLFIGFWLLPRWLKRTQPEQLKKDAF